MSPTFPNSGGYANAVGRTATVRTLRLFSTLPSGCEYAIANTRREELTYQRHHALLSKSLPPLRAHWTAQIKATSIEVETIVSKFRGRGAIEV